MKRNNPNIYGIIHVDNFTQTITKASNKTSSEHKAYISCFTKNCTQTTNLMKVFYELFESRRGTELGHKLSLDWFIRGEIYRCPLTYTRFVAEKSQVTIFIIRTNNKSDRTFSL